MIMSFIMRRQKPPERAWVLRVGAEDIHHDIDDASKV